VEVVLMPVVKLSEVPELSEIGPDIDTLVMKKAIGSSSRDPNFRMADSTESLSLTYIKIFGRLRRIRCDESDRAMFVVDGDAIVKVGEEAPVHVTRGDFVLIPKGTPYEFKGNLTYVVVNSPAYREGSDLRNESYDGLPTRPGKDAWA
jgi:mannose-6-phosphate isomerase-like protein (cupin superfamily)